MAIAAERSAQELYSRLAGMFAHHPQVADFWKAYAAEEAGHATWLSGFREKLTPEQLSAPADATMVHKARQVLGLSIGDALGKVKTLEDAYQLAHELESSETNVVCEFLIDNFASDEKTHAFLRAQLRNHIARLMTGLPMQFRGTADRHGIEAIPPKSDVA
jgi:rubrerythrin